MNTDKYNYNNNNNKTNNAYNSKLMVVDGLYTCQQDRTQELNNRMFNRNVPDTILEPSFDFRPVMTKYSRMPIVDQKAKPSEKILRYPTYSPHEHYNVGNRSAPWSGFASNVNTESTLRNQFFALQKCEQSEFVPSSNSDLYQTKVDYVPQKQNHPLLFEKPDLEPFNPNVQNLGSNLFNNHTRYQLKDSSCM